MTACAAACPPGPYPEQNPSCNGGKDPECCGTSKLISPERRNKEEAKCPRDEGRQECPDDDARENHELPVNCRRKFLIIFLLLDLFATTDLLCKAADLDKTRGTTDRPVRQYQSKAH